MDHERIRSLRKYILNLKAEIVLIDFKQDLIPIEKYIRTRKEIIYRRNLLIIAQNELNAILHLYKAVLTGNVLNKRGLVNRKELKQYHFSEINCSMRVFGTKNDPENYDARTILDELTESYSKLFVSDFDIKRVYRIR